MRRPIEALGRNSPIMGKGNSQGVFKVSILELSVWGLSNVLCSNLHMALIEAVSETVIDCWGSIVEQNQATTASLLLSIFL